MVQAELIEPAVKGTLNVLSSACAKTRSVKRVIVTSSLWLQYSATKNLKLYKLHLMKRGFLIKSSIRSQRAKKILIPINFTKQFWYTFSKTLAEEAAWKFAKKHGIDMVTIHPSVMIGSLLQPTLNQSTSMILNLINGMVNIFCSRGNGNRLGYGSTSYNANTKYELASQWSTPSVGGSVAVGSRGYGGYSGIDGSYACPRSYGVVGEQDVSTRNSNSIGEGGEQHGSSVGHMGNDYDANYGYRNTYN
ncbi:hypothetical protein IFM89_033354 [Coptis chinensis]|uniref:Thioester reductase (TE) domain-containing protein n=1 Tax=Coptis chinensis TaxID=261450 RepID=A0A835HGK1_9MAGN|nr:hypothetical protein IFM89_033354 [Coptis chinensis]